MSELAGKILQQALALPVDERAEVAERLLCSLEPSLPAIDRLWTREAEDRIDAYERGEIASFPAEDVVNAIKVKCGSGSEYGLAKGNQR
jgi:putative addiction module component (TIGR02574 family)